MRTIIALPDYEQTGQIEALVSGQEMPLYKALKLSEFPHSCEISGIPNPILSRNPENNFVFAQVVRGNNNDYFLKSCRAGKDKTGRDVFLSFVFEFPKGGLNTLSDLSQIKADISILPEKIVNYGNLLNTFGSNKNEILSMFSEFKSRRDLNHLTSSSLKGLKYQADWSYGQKKSSPNNNTQLIKILGVIAIILIVAYLISKGMHPKNQ